MHGNNIKTVFAIGDLENLSGIKAHTIRVWERRYNLLEPIRSDLNVRAYDIANLQKLLNVVLLMKYGFKPSRISKMSIDEMDSLVWQSYSEKYDRNHISHRLKLAMMTFDQHLFMETYEHLLSHRSFRQVFFEYFIPLLEDIGVLWQTRTITPAHEHFISYLIRLKILNNTNALLSNAPKSDKVYILFLPVGEIHELGLLYLNYELVAQGFKTIYLGESVPINSLESFKSAFKEIIYVAYATVAPSKHAFKKFVSEVHSNILTPQSELWVVGAMVHDEEPPFYPQIKFFNTLKDALHEI
ncbi:MerR family transcriptional regulator [Flavobacterium pallidum]|uniref:MerR family transcriptional regulator n=1 Tax=Flavobacterium pallidum TaxID=2172098 RepID=A0A2S1SJZ4_9FLAO|nr:MerR family transcriptional regulator [Flavobacterium pallidum]AWI26753.1 MerR family transcriptional regulator [Flavobacterium pallidum]